jgi:glutathionyl-hydroquinone reductase
MATVAPQFASPVDYEAYGVYGPKAIGGADRTFVRPRYPFQGRVSADGRTGFRAEPGRYHLYIALGCPWAHRAAIVRRLKKLTDVVSLSLVDDVRDGRGWAFRAARGPDPVNGFTLLRQAYEAAEPGYPGHISVPVLWDRQTSRIVSNNFPDITIDLETQFEEWADRATDLYPVPLRPQIDELNALVYETVNNAVYRIGNTSYQEEYDELTGRLFATFDELERRLADRRFLFGDAITEADIRLWVTLARFDAAYHGLFKVNLRRLTDYPNLWGYARDMYQRPAFRETTDFGAIKTAYYAGFARLNPARIIPAGPDIDWEAPHGRDRLPR